MCSASNYFLATVTQPAIIAAFLLAHASVQPHCVASRVMRTVLSLAIISVIISGCLFERGTRSDQTLDRWLQAMEGRTVDQLLAECGAPDRTNSASNYGALFQNGKAARVFVYSNANSNVFIDEADRVLGIAPQKVVPGEVQP